jgi:Predicted DNA-binding protein containing a Zn-ribbon domain
MVYVGIDDTDSRNGMCTTYLATLIVEELERRGIRLIDYPRLVRLNPNIPWKTRGNGALALEFGHGNERKSKIGDRFCIYHEKNEKNEKEEDLELIFEVVKKLVEKNAMLKDENTNPGLVVASIKPDRSFYERCVKDLVPLKDAIETLDGMKALYKGYKDSRGLIGATASISYEPRMFTFELVAYRKRESIGKKRFVEEKSVIEMDKKFPFTFDNYDYQNKHVCIAPNSPCPVLFGVRSTTGIGDIENVLKVLKTEDIERWITYKTNQASDEHLERKRIGELRKNSSGIIEGFVTTRPEMIERGHVIFKISDGSNVGIDCAAYEPTKDFRKMVLKLRSGDKVMLYGGLSKYTTFNIEKMEIKEPAKAYLNPLCCGKRMKSMGKGQGFRCEKCGRKTNEKEEMKRDINKGFYEVPPSARRHLSMPLKIMLSS